MDIAGLSKLTADSLILVVAVLGFMVCPSCQIYNCEAEKEPQTFGFSTKEFEVTADRLGVYLPVVRGFMSSSSEHLLTTTYQEHIDNPK